MNDLFNVNFFLFLLDITGKISLFSGISNYIKNLSISKIAMKVAILDLTFLSLFTLLKQEKKHGIKQTYLANLSPHQV